MSDSVEFGDFEADDAWADEPADPEQVAIRMHELRQYLTETDGQELADWDALSDDDKEIGTALMGRLLDAFANDESNAPQDLNAAIAYLSGQPEWDQLSPEAQQVGTALVDNILEWGTKQGSINNPNATTPGEG